MAGPATFSTVYTEADKGGPTVSCTDAWTHISDRLSDPVLFDNYTSQICARTRYDTGHAQQTPSCRQHLAEVGQRMPGRPLRPQAFLTHRLLGTRVGVVLIETVQATAPQALGYPH